MSHAEKFSRKTELVRDMEAAMEECLDQDLEILHPADPEATCVSRAAATLSRKHGPCAALCMPLRHRGDVVAALLVERTPDRPLEPDEIEGLRLTCDLCSAPLMDLHDHDRWFGAKAATAARKALGRIVGPTHTWMKLNAVLGFGAILFLLFVKTDFYAEAPFTLEATTRRVLVAPFDSYLATVNKRVGDVVEAGTDVLATLETAELDLQLAAAKADLAACLSAESVAVRDGKAAEAQMARAKAQESTAQIDLLEYKINRAKITSDMAGLVVSGDLERQLGAAVKSGDVLFEVARLDMLRVVLSVPEDVVPDIAVGLTGEFATAAYPGTRIPLRVDRIDPIAEIANQRNVFKVRAQPLESHDWMRPGMRGVAKIKVGRRSYGWIWTRRLVNWTRMKLWI